MKKVLYIGGAYLAVGIIVKVYTQNPKLSSVLTWPLDLIPIGVP